MLARAITSWFVRRHYCGRYYFAADAACLANGCEFPGTRCGSDDLGIDCHPSGPGQRKRVWEPGHWPVRLLLLVVL